jgi:flagellar hook-associated protein 1
MGSLTASLSIVLQSLDADEGAIDVTTNNIANANTPGYARQVVNLADSAPVQYGGLTFGTGVTLQQATSVRDGVLQLRINQETAQSGQLDAFLGEMNQIQAVFNETGGVGLQQPLSAFYASFQQLSTGPSDSSLRVGVLSAAQNLAEAFNQASAALTTQQSNLNLSVQQSVSQINELTSQVAQLNGTISGMTAAGEDASAFVNQRDVALQNLSTVIGVNVVQAGNGSYTITTGNGAALVVGNQSFALTTQTNASTGVQDVYSQGQDITSAITGGQLGGQIQVRDQQIPSALNQLDTLAAGVANSVNTQSQAGYDLNGNPGVNFFTPPSASGAGAAAALQVAISDPSLIAASSDGTPGSNGNANALAALANQPSIGGLAPAAYYSGLVFQIGDSISNATAEQTSVSQVLTQLQNQRGALSGVSLDEEAANLTKFQQAYDASAKVVTTIADLMDEAINLGQD